MPSKLSRYCEGLMEAAWLAAIILIPVFFNVYSSRIFEPDKITILRSLALIISASWIVKFVDEGRVRWEKVEPGESRLRTILSIPLIIPVVALIIAYLIATLFSVTPRTSLLGSYQRLQGTYSTFSYIIIFAALIVNLRKRSQVDRIITIVVLSSLPVALYGVLQRYGIDPVPWGGDTSRRIAANMGNSIFVAAFLIMVFPLTVGRIVESFGTILGETNHLVSDVARSTIYVFIAALQLVAIYMSGSRGPALGWMAGTYLLFLLLSLNWKKRWLTFTILITSILGGAFLAVFNIPNGPLETLRQLPGVGRFGLLLDAESNSALVRKYIWEGAVDLVSPHAPLTFPDGGTDTFNALRPLIGYGPESMYVAYNPFYPPLLGHVERRNASPDRSHNETWDSMVITGGIGLVAYLALFVSVFYYGIKWIGLVRSDRQRNLLLAMMLGGGLVGAIGLTIWRGFEYVGVGLPFGIAAGLILYLAIFALFGKHDAPRSPNEAMRSLTLIILVSAILAHFVEINFGIAIAATRTYFWVYAGLLLLVGFILPKYGEYELNPVIQPAIETPPARREKKSASSSRRRRTERSSRSTLSGLAAWNRNAIISGLIIGLLLATLGYNYVSNSNRITSASQILSSSLTRLPNKGNALSYGILALILTTWAAAAIVLTAENGSGQDDYPWLKAFGLTLGVSFVTGMLFWIWHAGSLAALARFTPATADQVVQQVDQIGGLLTRFYFYIGLLLFVMAIFIPQEWPVKALGPNAFGAVAAPVLALVSFALVFSTNLRVVHADIAFKMADPFASGTQWPVATLLYKHALELAPNEDHYYLFLGRSYLEQAKTETDPNNQQALVEQAEKDLKVAQKINPLNTDHTANLARLYSWWASQAPDDQTRLDRGKIASNYYAKALQLSPHNSTLWGEWAILDMDILHNTDQAYQHLLQAVSLDDAYNWTQGLLGDYFNKLAHSQTDAAAKKENLLKAGEYYAKAYKVSKSSDRNLKIGYLINLGNVNYEVASLDPQNIDKSLVSNAIEAYLEAVKLKPKNDDLYRIEEQIARLYTQLGDKQSALEHANAALLAAPDGQQERLQSLIEQIQALP